MLFRPLGLAFALALTFGVSGASADSLTLTLNNPNSGLNGYAGPYGTVQVSISGPSSTATITVTNNTVGPNTYIFGASGAIGLNTHGAASLGSIVTYTQVSVPTQAPSYSQSSGNEDGFGSFNFVLDGFDGYQHAVATLTFTITKASGTWANAADVLTGNANGYLAAAHVFATTNGGATNTGVTGFSTDGGGGNTNLTTPAPAGVVLMGAGVALLGLVGWSRRRPAIPAA
jgi:hypothetical protein